MYASTFAEWRLRRGFGQALYWYVAVLVVVGVGVAHGVWIWSRWWTGTINPSLYFTMILQLGLPPGPGPGKKPWTRTRPGAVARVRSSHAHYPTRGPVEKDGLGLAGPAGLPSTSDLRFASIRTRDKNTIVASMRARGAGVAAVTMNQQVSASHERRHNPHNPHPHV